MRRLFNFATSSFNWIRVRGVDPGFADDENLYHAINPDDIDDDEEDGRRPNVSAIRFPTLSVNRSKYSGPKSVLIGKFRFWESWRFRRQDLPVAISFEVIEKPRRGEIDTFSFSVEHDPTCTKYAHSEVRTYRNGQRYTKKRPEGVRQKYRLHMRRKMDPSY